jgi:phenylalanyl-tRNA synthetase beta chain
LTYSFVHGDLLKKVGQNPEHAFQLSNALSPDLQYYRMSLLPSLLDKVHGNVKAGYDEFALFEIGKVHLQGNTDSEGLPREDDTLALVVTANDKLKRAGAPYYAAKRYLEALVRTPLTYQPVPQDMRTYDITKPFDTNRTAFVYAGDKFLGLIGEFRSSVTKALKLPHFTAGFELDTLALSGLLGAPAYEPLSRFPKVTQDISLKVKADLPYGDLYAFVYNEIDKARPDQSRATLTPLDIYQRENDDEHKQVTLRLQITSYEKTLRDTEVNGLLDSVAAAAKAKFGAERI